MSTVRCPNCDRALKRPEGTDRFIARCPLCGHEFGVTGEQPRAVPVPRSRPPRLTSLPPTPPADAKAIYWAAWWLLAAGLLVPLTGCVLGPFHSVWIVLLFLTPGPAAGAVASTLMIVCVVAQPLAAIILFKGAESVRRHGGGRSVALAVWVLRIYGVAYLLGAVRFFFAGFPRNVPDAEEFRHVVILISLLVGGMCLLAARQVTRLGERADS